MPGEIFYKPARRPSCPGFLHLRLVEKKIFTIFMVAASLTVREVFSLWGTRCRECSRGRFHPGREDSFLGRVALNPASQEPVLTEATLVDHGGGESFSRPLKPRAAPSVSRDRSRPQARLAHSEPLILFYLLAFLSSFCPISSSLTICPSAPSTILVLLKVSSRSMPGPVDWKRCCAKKRLHRGC